MTNGQHVKRLGRLLANFHSLNLIASVSPESVQGTPARDPVWDQHLHITSRFEAPRE